jgi:putative Ca2+/H+ antiporter (TMEM165/GDT1 family)
MGDKTQIATVVLAAHYAPLLAVVVGTTIGMLLANLPVIALGTRFSARLPLRAARCCAAAIFIGLAIAVVVHD